MWYIAYSQIINLIITQIENPNIKVSATNQCSPNVVKPGMIEAKKEDRKTPRINLDHITCNNYG